MKEFYLKKIQERKEKNLYRIARTSDFIGANLVLRAQKKLISFASNDYFGLSQNKQMKKASIKAIQDFGTSATASRYVCGANSLNVRLEKVIAKFKGFESALIFPTGYSCCLGVVSALVEKDDLIVADRLIHASLIDGCLLSGAKLMRFPHNDFLQARQILVQNRNQFKKCLIITETVFSMDGDLGNVKELKALAQEFDCLFLEDAAHEIATIVKGSGSACGRANSVGIFLKIGTFSKAFGSLGGFVCGSKEIIDFLRNFARPQIYSTALPPAVLAASLQAVKIAAKKELDKKALENANYFCKLMSLPEAASAIVVIILESEEKVLKIAKKVEEKGFLISAIRYPTVEKNKPRLRICFNTNHSKKEIERLSEVLESLL